MQTILSSALQQLTIQYNTGVFQKFFIWTWQKLSFHQVNWGKIHWLMQLGNVGRNFSKGWKEGLKRELVLSFPISQSSFYLCVCLMLQIASPRSKQYGCDHSFSLATLAIKCNISSCHIKIPGENSNWPALNLGPLMKQSLGQRAWTFFIGRSSASPYGSIAVVQMSKWFPH